MSKGTLSQRNRLLWPVAMFVLWALWIYVMRINNANEEKRLKETLGGVAALRNRVDAQNKP